MTTPRIEANRLYAATLSDPARALEIGREIGQLEALDALVTMTMDVPQDGSAATIAWHKVLGEAITTVAELCRTTEAAGYHEPPPA